jgi:hypothetical protein
MACIAKAVLLQPINVMAGPQEASGRAAANKGAIRHQRLAERTALADASRSRFARKCSGAGSQ